MLHAAGVSSTARLTELRAERAARALIDVHHALETSVLDDLEVPDGTLEKLHAIRELAVIQLERLGGRVRRNGPLRLAIEAACRSYRDWTSHETGSSGELRTAEDLSVAVLRLRSALGAVPARSASGGAALAIGFEEFP